MVSETTSAKSEKGDDQPKTNLVLGGYECNDEYTYIRGRGELHLKEHKIGKKTHRTKLVNLFK